MTVVFSATQASVTRRLLAMKFAAEFMLFYPLFTIMFGERGRVSASGIGILLAAGFVLSVIFEIPTGVIADKMPRKHVLLYALVCKFIAIVLCLALPSFAGYFAAVTVFSLSSALESGALQAYLYGTLGTGHKQAFGKFWARVSSMIMLAYTVSYILASVIGVRYPLLLSLSLVACFVALVICYTLPKDTLPIPKSAEKPRILKAAFKHIIATPDLLKLLLTSIIVIALVETMIEYLPLYYNQVGITTRSVPLVLALGNIIGALLFWTLPSWERFLNKQKVLLTVGFTALFVISFFGGLAVVCGGALIFTRYLRVLQVQFESNMQHLASEDARATITSIGSFGARLGAAGVAALVGAAAINNSIVQPLRWSLIAGTGLFIVIHLALGYVRNTHQTD